MGYMRKKVLLVVFGLGHPVILLFAGVEFASGGWTLWALGK